MEKKIRIYKSAHVIVEGRLMIDIEAVKERFGGKKTKKGLSIPMQNIKVHKTENGEEFVYLPYKGDGITAEIAIPLKRLTKN